LSYGVANRLKKEQEDVREKGEELSVKLRRVVAGVQIPAHQHAPAFLACLGAMVAEPAPQWSTPPPPNLQPCTQKGEIEGEKMIRWH